MSDLWLPIRNRRGEIIARTVIDSADSALANQAWSLHCRGYAIGHRSGKMRLLHRVIMGLENGPRPLVDHRDRNKLNNRRSNLRRVTYSGNGQNSNGKSSTSRHNVYLSNSSKWHPGLPKRWNVRITLDDRTHYLGTFDSPEEAEQVASEWRAQNWPLSQEAVCR